MTQPRFSSRSSIHAVLALLALQGFAYAQPSPDIALKLDDRAMRAAGISTAPLEQERGAGTDLTLAGTVAIPQHQIRVVATPAAGMVEVMFIAADDPVRAGQPLAQIRSPAIVEAQRQFLAALADEELAADRLRRAQIMFEGKALPERDWRIAQTEAVHARSRMEERTQILTLMEMTDSDIDALRTTRRILSAVTVTAPISGTIVTRHVSPGERVDAAAPLYTIAELEPLWVNIQVPAARLPTIKPGAGVNLPAYGAQGRVIRIGRTVDQGTQSAIAVAAIDTGKGSVRPGLAVAVTVHLDTDGDPQWTAPPSAVVRHRDRTWVFVRTPQGFVARPVQVVSESVRGSLFRGSFSPGDQIATRGILSLTALLIEADKD